MNLKVTSTNIRFENPRDEHNDWPFRKEMLAKTISEFSPDIVGTQEGREPQIRDFESLFTEFSLVDDHRDWIEKRMYPCLLYNEQKFKVLESGDIWLSNNPYEPGSKSFESAFPRLLTWAKFQNLLDKTTFMAANVHLDHVLDSTRESQAKVLTTEVLKQNPEDLPLVLMGDFNASPNSKVRKIILSEVNVYDPWLEKKYPEETSYHKFEGKLPEGERIDWILVDPRVKTNDIFLNKYNENNRFPSDHFPLMGEFKL